MYAHICMRRDAWHRVNYLNGKGDGCKEIDTVRLVEFNLRIKRFANPKTENLLNILEYFIKFENFPLNTLSFSRTIC